MEKARDSRFLAFLGALGFLGFQPVGPLQGLVWLSLLSLGSLMVFVPFDAAKVSAPINPKRKYYLVLLVFLLCLGFLFSGNPKTATFAMFASPAILAAYRKQST